MAGKGRRDEVADAHVSNQRDPEVREAFAGLGIPGPAAQPAAQRAPRSTHIRERTVQSWGPLNSLDLGWK